MFSMQKLGGKFEEFQRKMNSMGLPLEFSDLIVCLWLEPIKCKTNIISTWKLVFDKSGFASFIYEYHRKFVRKIQLKDAIGLRSITEYNSNVNVL